MAVIDFFRKALSKMIPKSNIEKRLNISIATSAVMDRGIELWSMMYENNPPWRGGDAGVIPLNLPAAISEEMARLVLTEFSIKLTGSARADYLNKQLKNNLVNLSDHMELFCAKGGICLKPFISTGGTIDIDFTQADRFFPTAYNSNKEITGAVFVDSKRQGDYVYTRLESHNLNGTDYTIVNKAFRSERLTGQAPDDDFISVQHPYQTPVPLSEVEEWASLSEEPVVINNVEKPLFVYIKMPRANNLDPNSPLGTSVYSRATEVIEQADRQFSRILWEYDATEAAIHASADMFDSDKSGKPILPAGRERLYRAFDFESKESFLKEYAPEIRSDPLFKGLNKYFQRIEFLVGLSYGTISDPQDIEKTAEEIRTSKQRSYTVVSRIQSSWDNGFDALIYAMDVLCTLYNLAPAGGTEKATTWGDGVLEDTDKEYQRRWAMVLAGKYKLEKFYAWYFGCSEEEAKEMIPEAPAGNYPPEE